MNKYVHRSLWVSGLTIFLVVLQTFLPSPWWAFLVFTFLLGALLPKNTLKEGAFFIGFISGFLAWIMPLYYFKLSYGGVITEKLVALFDLPFVIILLATGIIGGLLTSLALLSGVQLRSGKKEMELELDEREGK